MYGYLRPNTADIHPAVRRRYRRYYCALCHALWNCYGQPARLLVSYDMTFAAVVLSSRLSLPSGKITCWKKRTLPEEGWRKLASLTVILAAGKLDDNIADDRSLAARAGKLLMGRMIRKARAQYPETYRAVKEEMARFNRMEKEAAHVRELADCFSGVIARGVQTLFPDLNQKEEAILRYVTGWIYLIDAVDDLDEDLRKGKPNPFAASAASREELLTRKSGEIRDFAEEQTGRFRSAVQAADFGSPDDRIAAAILGSTIPQTTARVFSLIPGYPPGGARSTRKIGGILYG